MVPEVLDVAQGDNGYIFVQCIQPSFGMRVIE